MLYSIAGRIITRTRGPSLPNIVRPARRVTGRNRLGREKQFVDYTDGGVEESVTLDVDINKQRHPHLCIVALKHN